ncbi:MAG: hypothetical protein DMG11_06005, partial [Acidobacteria bacterium]
CQTLDGTPQNPGRDWLTARKRFLSAAGQFLFTWGVCGRGFLQPYSVERCNHQQFVAHGISIFIAPDEDKCCRFARRATLRHCIRCVPAFNTNLSLVQGPPPVVRLLA